MEISAVSAVHRDLPNTNRKEVLLTTVDGIRSIYANCIAVRGGPQPPASFFNLYRRNLP
jgi:hypothetical protein